MEKFYIIGVIIVIILIIVLPCIFFYMQKKAMDREQELKRAIYIMEVQKILFETHTDCSCIEKALQKCAEILQAERAFILTLENKDTSYLYQYSSHEQIKSKHILNESFSIPYPVIAKNMREHNSLVLNRIEDASEDFKQEVKQLQDLSIRNIILTPVFDSRNKIQAVLGVLNYEKMQEDAELLECVASNFLMAILNYNSYQKIEEMATVDMLTGLKNRNSYQQDVRKLSEQMHQSLCCIYMDVNGLHEMNNHLGHAAGDEMLRAVGRSMRNHFGDEYSYRLGGDEFVTFCRDMPRDEADQKLENFLQDMNDQHYQISVGSYWENTALQIDTMVSNAEKKMYENKRRYYEKKGDVSKAREMNRKLEETLLQKKDFEYFLTLIAHYFLGVYVVDLYSDNTRAIFKPSYFDEILKYNENKYQPSLKEYCRRFVKEEDQKKIYDILDYDNIMEDLLDQRVINILYEKTDGTHIRLRVYPSAEFCENRKDTFWLFEGVSARC